MPGTPPQFPLMGLPPTYDTRLHEPSGKITLGWSQDAPLPLLVGLSASAQLKESRKRYRSRLAGPQTEHVPPQQDSGDDMVLSDSGLALDSGLHPPKRRLTLEQSHDAPLAVPAPQRPARLLLDGEAKDVHPCTPAALESLAASPLLDADGQPTQLLVLPLPSASPVDLEQNWPVGLSDLEKQLARAPRNQNELVDMIVGLSGFVLDRNKNNLIFLLLQRVGRQLLLSLCNIIHVSLNHDILSALPSEITLNILSHLDSKSLLNASLVSRLWNRLISNTELWCYLLKRDDLIVDDATLRKELSQPQALLRDWGSPSPYLQNMNTAQILYKKRHLILKRWMDPSYEPRRISSAGHGTSIVTCLQHDEDKVITGIEGKLIHIQSAKTGKPLRLLKGHDGDVWALKYFSNTLVSGSTDRDVRIWNIRTGRCTHVFKGHTSTVRCLDILHPVQIGVNDNDEPVFFPEKPLLVTGSRDYNLHVWRLPLDNESEEGDLITEPEVYDAKDPRNPYLINILSGHTQSVRCVTGYGNIVISGSYDTTARVWDLLDGSCKCVLEGHSDKIYSVVLDFENRRCFSGSMDLSINVWDFDQGRLLYLLEGHNLLVGLLELSDKYLVSAAADSTLRVWDYKTGENLSKLKGHNSAITCFQHDGLRIVSGSDRMLKLWDIKTGKFVRDLLLDITSSIWQVSFDSDRCVAAVHTLKNGREETYIEILDFSEPLNHAEKIHEVLE